MQMEHSAGVGPPEDDALQLTALFHAHRPPTERDQQQQFFDEDDGLLGEDELVDLQELGTLSDGDLCMGRQLVSNSMALANEKAPKEVAIKSEPSEEYYGKPINERQQQRPGTVPNITAEECLGRLVVDGPSVETEFLPTEAVEQFLLGMDDNGHDERSEAMAQRAANVKGEEAAPGESSEQQPKQKKPKRASSSEESRTAASSPSAEFSAPPPPPIVISPQDVDNISITLEKNQQCACKDCGKLFNSVWYLKQHAVKHSNDRPFKCRFCMKTYKFRSNLYQHKCPERSRLLLTGEFNMVGHPYRRRAYNRTGEKGQKAGGNNNGNANVPLPSSSMSVDTSPIGGDIYVPNFNSFMPLEENGEGPRLLITAGKTNATMGREYLLKQQTEFTNLQQQQPHQNMALNGGGDYGPMPPHIFSPTGVDAMPPNNGLCHPSDAFATPHAFDSAQFVQLRNGPSSSAQTPGSNGRERELPIELIEEYMRRNKHRVFNCRKCKLYFPSREYFARHLAYHDEMEEHKYCCEKCPERFPSDVALQAHQLQHAEQSPHCCLTCNGIFRSALALRRHKDNWRQCHSPLFGLQYSLAVNPIDQYSFVGSDLDEIEFGTERSEAEEEDDGMEEGEEDTITGENGTLLPSTLMRKTTRDSGYQGSDTYSPSTGSHSPNALESDDQHLLSVSVHSSKRDRHGRFVQLKNGKGQHKNGGKKKANEESKKSTAEREGSEGRESVMDRNNNQRQTQQPKWAET